MNGYEIKKVLISEEELKAKVSELARKINEDYKGKEVLLVTLLKGGVVFVADLMRGLNIPVELEFMSASSYGNSNKSSGNVKITKDLDTPIEGKHVLIVEDIIDTGKTLSEVIRLLHVRNPASIKLCTILDKSVCRKTDLEADYVGFEIPDEFVVGYGLDYAGKFRNLPYVAVIGLY